MNNKKIGETPILEKIVELPKKLEGGFEINNEQQLEQYRDSKLDEINNKALQAQEEGETRFAQVCQFYELPKKDIVKLQQENQVDTKLKDNFQEINQLAQNAGEQIKQLDRGGNIEKRRKKLQNADSGVFYEKRQEIFKNIEIRLECMNKIQKSVEQYQEGGISFSEYLDGIIESALQIVPESGHLQHEAIQHLEQALISSSKETREVFELRYPGKVTYSDVYFQALREDPVLSELASRDQKLEEELSQQHVQDEAGWAQFIDAVHALHDSWIAKHKRINSIGGDRKAIAEAIDRIHFGEDRIGEDDIVDIKRTPIELVITLTKEGFQRTQRSNMLTGGFHIVGSSLTVVPHNAPSSTLRHESIHNLSDSFLEYAPPYRIFHTEKQPAEYLDRMQGEIVTAASDWEAAGHISHGEPISLNTTLEQVEQKFYEYARNLTTAGQDIQTSIGFFNDRLAEKELPEEQRKLLTILVPRLMREFVQVGTTIEYDMALARRISEQAGEEAELLLFLLKPSKYRHIRTWLEERYGERMQQEEAIMRVERFSTGKELDQALRNLGTTLLPLKTQTTILRNVDWLTSQYLEINTLEDSRIFRDNLIRLAKLCPGISSDTLEHVAVNSYEQFFAKLIISGLDDSVNISETILQLDAKEHAMLIQIITGMLESGEIYRAMRSGDIVHEGENSCEVIKTLPIGSLLTQLGIVALPEEQLEKENDLI